MQLSAPSSQRHAALTRAPAGRPSQTRNIVGRTSTCLSSGPVGGRAPSCFSGDGPRSRPGRATVGPAKSREEDVEAAVDSAQVMAFLKKQEEEEARREQEEARREKEKEKKKIRQKQLNAEKRAVKRQKELELKSMAIDSSGVSAKEFNKTMKAFLALVPGMKEQKLLATLSSDPQSLSELLTDPGVVATKMMQLSRDHPAFDITSIVSTWPLILTSRHRSRFMLVHPDGLSCAAVSPDGAAALTGSSDGAVRAWDLRTGACTAVMLGHASDVTALSITADGKHAVSSSTDNSLRLWDLQGHTSVGQMSGQAKSLQAVAVTPDGRQALSGSHSGDTLCLWDLSKLRQVATLLSDNQPSAAAAAAAARRSGPTPAKVLPAAVFGVAVSADGRRAVSGGSHLHLWDLPSRTLTATLLVPNSPLQNWCLDITPDGRLAAVGCSDGTVQVWDLDRRACAAVLRGHTGQVRCVTATADGRHAVSGSNDGTLRVWELATGSCVAVLEGHVGAVVAVAVSEDGRHVLSGGKDPVMRVWDLQAALKPAAPHPGGPAAPAVGRRGA